MNKEINKITIVSGEGIKSFTVGDGDVVSIIDGSIEFENSVDFIYHIYGEDKKLLHSIENCPVVIDYK